MELNKIYNREAIGYLETLPNNSIDATIIDPPYLYKILGGGGKSCFGDTIKKINHGLEELRDGFDFEIFEVLKQKQKKFNLFVFCNNALISKIMAWGEANNYSTTLLVWHKINAVPFSNGTWRQDLEFIVHIREKSATFKGGVSLKSKVFTYPMVANQIHPTQKPLDIIRKLIRVCSHENDLIFDGFMGSGTTAIAYIEENRHFIGTEINPEYFKIAQERIEAKLQQKKIF